MRENKTASKEIRGSSHSCRFLFLPRYLRPIVDLEAHGPMSITEKFVRFIIFVPIMSGIVLIPILSGIIFIASGTTILAAPAVVERFGLGGVVVIVIGLIAMYFIALGIRRYFLPFG